MSQEAPLIINLGKYQSKRSRVFVGRDRGKSCRVAEKLDQADARKQPVVINIPKGTYSVTPSFFLAMFGDSIRKHGEEGFMKLYSFQGWDAKAVIADGVREALSTDNPLW